MIDSAVFSTIGAFTFGGGLSMIALLEEHVVDRLPWLTPQDFIAGLAGVVGAAAAAAAVFMPSFALMLAILPVFDGVRRFAWARAVIQGIAPGVIGVMTVALGRMAPHAAPDGLAILVLVTTVAALLYWRLAPLKVMLGGGVVGVLRDRFYEVSVLRSVRCFGAWGRG